jgi:hypothetical protein
MEIWPKLPVHQAGSAAAGSPSEWERGTARFGLTTEPSFSVSHAAVGRRHCGDEIVPAVRRNDRDLSNVHTVRPLAASGFSARRPKERSKSGWLSTISLLRAVRRIASG